MEYTPVTSFRRPICAVMLKHRATARMQPAVLVNKWEALRTLAVARQHFALSDRDLSVLQTLLSFYPETELGADQPPAVVYPSNKAICERLNGMPCSTMRRHIARLVDAGIIARRDSPNGKRYVRRGGGPDTAFGFDLTPLAYRHAEFEAIASTLRETESRRKRLREAVSLMRRDLAGFAEYGVEIMPDLPLWDQIDDLARLTSRDLRRKLSIEELVSLKTKLQTALQQVHFAIDGAESVEVSNSGTHSEQHHQNTNKEYKKEILRDKEESAAQDESMPPPLRLVLETCKEIQSFTAEPITSWEGLICLSDTVSPMMGIAPALWKKLQSQMGHAQAAIVLSAMLERFGDIRSPSGYLTALAQRASQGAFSCTAMIRGLRAAEKVHSCEPAS
jgi:replication initiation protein RepC